MKPTASKFSAFTLVFDDFRRTSHRSGGAGLLAASLVLLAAGCSPPTTTSTTTGTTPETTVTVPTTTTTAPTPTATTTPTTTTTPTPTTTTTTTTTPETSGELVGEWKSPPCGARKYERRITLAKDGSFTAQDLVSPCPKGVACVWSGIVDTKGTWKQEGNTIRLTSSSQSTGPGMSSFPTTLTLNPATKALAEGADGVTCPYKR